MGMTVVSSCLGMLQHGCERMDCILASTFHIMLYSQRQSTTFILHLAFPSGSICMRIVVYQKTNSILVPFVCWEINSVLLLVICQEIELSPLSITCWQFNSLLLTIVCGEIELEILPIICVDSELVLLPLTCLEIISGTTRQASHQIISSKVIHR